ncbi:prepilin-type N-terminal cleavage/methylation domain-containing protein [Azospirillum canadense]|uniref:prepilin-type N-terminal cleavage/methylation domain-containing protein n=1 Tax=Azospirillum canadense TaxID=403962 RepID=UPI0022263C3C|nr:prepilin-type N-terminal cleavage/methylation domain-containing protein [Azospirillum canadense]MCW2239555.1 general secretion pathway protein J [Azospirillum canadense]
MMDRQRGFTLFELLIALSLLGLLTTVMYGGLRFSARTWEAASAHSDATMTIEAAQSFLRRSLEGARPPAAAPPSGAPRSAPVPFVGRPDALAFVTTLPSVLGDGDGVIELRTTDTGGDAGSGRRLLLRWTPLTSPGPPGDRTLIERVGGLRFRYFGASGEGGEARWWDAWPDPAHLPRLIRVSVSFPAGDGRLWPDFVATPMLDGDSPCFMAAQPRACIRP